MQLYGFLDPATGRLSNIYVRDPGPNDVPLAQTPAGYGPWTYDAVNQLAVPVAPRKPRTLLAIYNDLRAQAAQQQSAIWLDISSGSPAKYFSDPGVEPGAVSLYDFIIHQSGLPGTAITDAQFRLVAVYCRDVPGYLVNPAFAPTVNIPGDQPA